MNKTAFLAFGLLAGGAIGAGATYGLLGLGPHSPEQPYADEQGRTITSLSAEDVADLTAGRGWGLAKPAEFNNYPGPAHVIEHADALALDTDQRARIDASFEAMQSRARTLGLQLIEAEKALDTAFVDKTITREKLADLLAGAAHARADLRQVHLAAHLEVTPVLNDGQKAKYAELRGYGSGHKGH